jgi:hypothetical protein
VERLSDIPTIEPKTAWERRREWSAFIFSSIAIVLSIATGIVTLREIDDLRMVILNEPRLRYDEKDGRIVMRGELRVLFMNSGTRPIGLVGAWVNVGQLRRDSVMGVRCDGVEFSTDLRGMVVDGKEIIERAVELTPLVYSSGSPKREPDGWSFTEPKSIERGSINVCMLFQAASPSDAGIHKGIRFPTTNSLRADDSGWSIAAGLQPYVIVNEGRWRFW